MKDKELTIDYLKEAMQAVADLSGKHPMEVTPRQLQAYDENITPWKLRPFGGITGLRKYFPMSNKDLAEIKAQKDLASYVRRLENELGDKRNFEKSILESIESLKTNLPKLKSTVKPLKMDTSNKKMTIELLLSDIHYGKKTDKFNLKVCRDRMQNLTTTFIEEVKQKQKSFNVERLIIALAGDIIESYTMHGLESAISCEFGNSRQVQEAIESLFYDVLYPVSQLGLKVDVPCVTGNHDRSDLKKTYNMPGENHLSWIIYKMLESLTKAHKLDNLKFDIPKDSFTTLNIYGSNVLYEHGDELAGTKKDIILKHMEKRGRQLNKQIHMSRFGHWHEYVCFNRGQAIINESVCGQDSYAKVKGFDSTAGQTISFYVDTKKRPTSYYYSFPVFLG